MSLQSRFNFETKKVLPIVILVTIGVFIFLFYSADYDYPICCDTAITLIKAKQITVTGTTDALQTINPSLETPLYGSLISTEFPLHLLFSIVYQLDNSLMNDLQAAKILFIILFLLPILPIYLLGKKLFKNEYLSITMVVLSYFSLWFGNMYWLGHVAQMLGMFFMPLFFYFLVKYNESEKAKDLLIAFTILILSFIIHVLTFLVLILVLLTFLLFNAHKKFKMKKWVIVLGYSLFSVVFLIYLKYTPEAKNLLPSFSINKISNSILTVSGDTFSQAILLILFVVGGYIVVRKKNQIMLIWAAITILLTQSNFLDTPFYASRFNEFVILPLLIIMLIGFKFLLEQLNDRKIKYLVLLLFLVMIIPAGIFQQQDAKRCYVKNCVDLHPTQVPESDLKAFEWINSNISPDSVFVGSRKFGFYLPIVTNSTIEFSDGQKSKIFLENSSYQRWLKAKEYDVNYIFWDGIFVEQNNKVLGAVGYSNEFFSDDKYFSLVYAGEGVEIYEVK